MDSNFIAGPLLCQELIGREPELADLLGKLDQAERGKPQLVMLGGEAGMGKTRLYRALAEQAQNRATFLTGHALSQDRAFPFGPFLDALRRHYSVVSRHKTTDNPPGLTHLLRLLPEIEPLFPQVETVAFDTSGALPQQQYRLFQGILNGLREISQSLSGVLVLVLEDLHWADETSLELLAFLARQLGVNSSNPASESDRILIFGTYRVEALAENLALSRLLLQLNSQRQVHDMKLAPLDKEAHARMLSSILGQAVSDEYTTLLYQWNEGNPFFTEELLGAMMAGGQLQQLEGRWFKRAETVLNLPLSLKASILERVATLPEVDQKALSLASVVGREFDFDLLANLSELDERQLLATLRRAINLQLIAEVSSNQPPPGNSDSERYQFRHALTREAIYSDMLARERRANHRAVAETLEKLGREGSARLLASHYSLAGTPDKAHPYAMEEAERARQVFAFREERYYLQIGLEALPEDSAERLGILHRLGTLSLAIVDVPAALNYLTQAKSGYQSIGQHRRAASILVNLSFLFWFYQPERLTGLMDELESTANATLQEPQQDLEALSIYSQTAFSLASGDLNERAAEWVGRSFAVAEQIDNPLKYGALQFSVLAQGTVKVDGKAEEVEEGLAAIRKVIDFAMQYKIPDLVLVGYGVLFSSLLNLGMSERAEELKLEISDYETRTGSPRMSNLKGWHGFFSGEWDSPIAELREEVDRAPSATVGALNRVVLAHFLISQHELAEAQNLLEAALPKVEALQISYRAPAYWGFARLYTATRHSKQAAEYYEKLFQFWKTTEERGIIIPFLLDGIKFYADNDNLWKGRQWLVELQNIVAATQNPVGQAALLEAEGILSEAEGDPDEAAQLLEKATNAWEALKRPVQQALTATRWAALLLARPGNDKLIRQKAEALLQEAGALFVRLHIPGALAEVERLRQESRLELQSKRRTTLETSRNQFGGLTRREVQVLVQISAGLTNREIASTLNIAVGTVELHVNRILSKLECESRTQAAAYAIEQGWTKTQIPV